ncbi:MAG: hypothetical protein ISS52_04755 [Dehalococcoidia bacterium]|nr:hypothetical protein [Dehalococcoidia bacterium]
MDKSEMEKLKILLHHWIEHNKEHGDEFRKWAEKARDLGEATVQEDMLGAAQYMDKASESLLIALEELSKGRP